MRISDWLYFVTFWLAYFHKILLTRNRPLKLQTSWKTWQQFSISNEDSRPNQEFQLFLPRCSMIWARIRWSTRRRCCRRFSQKSISMLLVLLRFFLLNKAKKVNWVKWILRNRFYACRGGSLGRHLRPCLGKMSIKNRLRHRFLAYNLDRDLQGPISDRKAEQVFKKGDRILDKA